MADTAKPQVLFETTMGNFTVELNPEKAPVSCENFLSYVNESFYDGVIFHRVIPGFVVQGGGFNAEMVQKDTKAPIANEAKNGLSNTRASISYARTSDPNSATSQFFINVVDNSTKLDPEMYDPNGYAVFGEIVDGMDIVDAIVAVDTHNVGPYSDVPVTPVVINKASVL